MFEFLYPREYLPSVFHITPQKLRALGINTLIFDIDNTLVPYWIKVPTPELEEYFTTLRENGIAVSVLSNSREERSKVFCAKMQIPYVYRAGKPGVKGMERLLEKLGKKPSECAIAGDQIFTDVWVGNRSGVYSFLIKQVSPKDELITAPKRPLERLIVRHYCKKFNKEVL
ncbi:MAG: YqeG family HAD IIIA-type phosphatase [Firmicutes bacterium]|nr:YqeG family HAD IIIA-type phosphatase [Bacillota bacterium]